jgi:Protein of unknown function (DUF2934)
MAKTRNTQASAPSAPRENGNPAASSTKVMAVAPERIAERAYQIWQASGRPDGRDADHWFQAERELRTSAATRATKR